VRRRARLAGVIAAGALAACAASAQASQVVEITIPARGGEVSDTWLPRYPHGGPPRARVLLPDGYDPAKAYPLLVLLVGLNSNYSDWSSPGQGEIAKTAKGFGGIIVMPEGGDGWYADWWNQGKRGDPAWESYSLDQVIPQVLARYRIRPERRYHALAGVSMGGLGTAYLGGRLPGFFGSIAVISGLVDLELSPGEGAVQTGISQASAGQAPTDLNAVEGPPGGFYLMGHNPVRLAANLAQTRVFMTSGDGTPAPDSGQGGRPGADAAEEGEIIHPASNDYASALRAAGVDFVYRQHTGYHDWPNFRSELRDAIAWGLFKPVDEHPTSWVNDTVATHGRLWEFAYRFDSPPDRVVRFRRSGGLLGVSAAGSPVTITTDGGCVRHVATPAEIAVPARPCARLRLSVRPRTLVVGRWTRVRATVRPALAGAVVTLAGARALTDARGIANLRVCLRTPTRRAVRATAADRLPATTTIRAYRQPGSAGPRASTPAVSSLS
jgi:S-formylglutathione hydrolase FrmB